MTDYEFWHKDPNLIIAFHKEYYRRLHEEAHAQGFYGFVAVSTALSNAFRKKGEKSHDYMQKPIDPFKGEEIKRNLPKLREKSRSKFSWLNSMSNN